MDESAPLVKIDRLSFEIGMINCFVEMIACGVKRLALSPPLSPGDFEKIEPWSKKIVTGFGVKSWLEKSLISTDLQSEEFTAGKWVIMYYKTDDVLESYLELKKKRKRIDETEKPDPNSLKALSKDFMRLLSYPDDVIETKLSGKSADPYIVSF